MGTCSVRSREEIRLINLCCPLGNKKALNAMFHHTDGTFPERGWVMQGQARPWPPYPAVVSSGLALPLPALMTISRTQFSWDLSTCHEKVFESVPLASEPGSGLCTILNMLPFLCKTLVSVTDRAENTESFLKRKVSLSSHFDISL